MKISMGLLGAFIIGGALALSPIDATANDFYTDQSVTFIVGYRAGGGYDTYTRAVARHIAGHIPGLRSAIVENKGGAGSLVAANYVYTRSEPDGLTAGVFGGGLVTQQALGSRGIRFDARRFNWVGSMSSGSPTCAIMGFTGLKTLDDVLNSKRVLKIGSTGPGSTTDDLPKLLIGLMGANFNVIRGFKGTSGIRVAMQRQELDGACWTWDSMKVTGRSMLEAEGAKRLIPYLIEGHFEDPEVRGLPQISEVVKGEENRMAIRAWLAPYKMLRPIALPPNTPKDRVEIWRNALKNTFADSKFLADVKKLKLDIDYLPGPMVEQKVDEALNISPQVKAKLNSLIGSKN